MIDINIDVVLPDAPDADTSKCIGSMPELGWCEFEPVGRWFEAFSLRRQHKQSVTQSLPSSSSEEEESEKSEEEEEGTLLATLDPKEWKNQDHYAVLGLKKLRRKATEDQIKRAYKKKVLHHHPDKRRARGLPVKDGEEDYFTCITRAWETLGNPVRRRAYDSIDPEFDDAVPSLNSTTKENFYQVFDSVFERNAQWSVRKPVPLLGDENTDFDSLNDFYSFWYEFDSWREYSYLDEEEKEKGENRDERRWIEKQNKAARAKKKKEETARIRQLVDNAYSCDPRIEKWKTEEKNKKLREKEARREAVRKRQEEEDRKKQEAEEEERQKKEKEQEELKAKAAAAKKEREQKKKLMKKEKETMRDRIKEYDYFTSSDAEKVKAMEDVEKLAELLNLTSLQDLNTALTSGDQVKAKDAFSQHLRLLNERLEKERQEMLSSQQQKAKAGDGKGGAKGKTAWSEEELRLLIKAVNLFPAGTNSRWEAVASFITQHLPSSKRTAKEVLSKAKDLQSDMSLKDEANKKAFEKFAKATKNVEAVEKAEASERYMSAKEAQLMETGSNPAPWTAEEQKLLEQGIKTYGADVPDRWEKISASINMRSKKDCLKRYKELVELIKAKKIAQAEAAKRSKKQ